jgi:general secretion pathway protein D
MNRRAVSPAFAGACSWIGIFAALAVFSLASAPLLAESARTLFKRGEAAEAKEDLDTAFDDYQKAYQKAPKDLQFKTAFYRIRIATSAMHVTKGRKLMQAGNEQGALAEYLHAAEIDPGNEAAQQEIARVRTLQGEVAPVGDTSLPELPGKEEAISSIGGPVDLRPVSNEPLTMHYSEDAKVIYQAIGKAAGINVLFDPDYNSKRISVDLVNSTLLDALRIVGTMSGTFWRPVTANTIFVAQNTRGKRTEMDEQAIETFYLSNAWQQNDLNDVQTVLRNVMQGLKVFGVASQNAIVVRGTPDELLLAQKLINDLDKARPEVVVDIAVLEVSKNWERTLGISWPSSIGVALQPPSTSTTTTTTTGTTDTGTGSTSTSPTLYDLSHLKASNFAVTIGSATANLLLTDSNTKILQNPRIRATDSQKAVMKIGSKIPIATGSYGGGGLGGVGGVGGIGIGVQTQFQYQDVGVNIEMTPTVHYDHDITIKIKIEVTSQSGSVTISGVTEPILSQRVVDQVIRLREGEANILGGIQDKQDQQSWTGIPGLSSIPILKYLFGSKDHTINDDEIVFLVVPHIVRSQQLDPVNLRTIDTGVGTSVELRRMPSSTTPQANPAPAPAAPPVRPSSNVRPSVGTVPGPTAAMAGPAALEQLKAAADAAGDAAATVVANPAVAAAAPGQPVSPPVSPAATGKSVSFVLQGPPGPVAVGSSFKVPVILSGGTDIASVPLQLQYDPAKLELVTVADGDLLSRDGQAPGLVHREDVANGVSTVTINASRPAGAAGVNGSGTVCVLTFTAKAAGTASIAISRPGAMNSAQQAVPARGGARVSIQVQ